MSLQRSKSAVTTLHACHPSRRTCLGLACLLPAALSSPARAGADRAAHEVRLVVPVEPGGGIDTMARLLARIWSTEHGVTATILNRPGASGNIGTASVAHAQPDGLTLLVTGVSHISSPLLHGQAGYDPLVDFVPVARLAEAPNVLMFGPNLRGRGLQQLLRDPRSRNNGWSFGSAGFGHTSHLAAEVLMARTASRWLHVPYRGTAPALRALMAGEVDLMLVPAASVPAAVATGRVSAVAVAQAERLPALPEVPTLRQLGVHEAEFAQWYGLLAPSGTPAAAVERWSMLAVKALFSPVALEQLRSQSVVPSLLGSHAFAQFLKVEQRRLSLLLKRERVERPVS